MRATIIIALLLLSGVAAWFLSRPYIDPINTKTDAPTVDEQQEAKQHIRVAAMGDMMAHDTIIANAKTAAGYDFGAYFNAIRSSYSSADVVFCNQEGLSAGKDFGISGYPSFNAPIEFSAGLQSGAGCNAINLANNHIGDKGVEATNETINVWKSLHPLVVSGANKNVDDQNKVSYTKVNDITLGFVAFADFNNNTNTPAYSINNYHDEALVRRLVSEARSKADVVMVSMHWGVEDSSAISSDQQQAVALLGSLGVDVVIGTGPHVLQKVETVPRPDGGKMVVWHSLGNMLSSQFDIRQLIGGVATFDIVKTEDKKVSVQNLAFIPTYMHYDWTAAEKASNDLLARKNAKIYLLKDAAEPLSRSLFGTNVAVQREYVIAALGSEVTVK